MKTKQIIFLLIGLLLIASLLTAVKPIKPGERAVVRRFGKVTATPEPGLWIGLPWGLDRIDLVSVQVRRVAIGYEKDMDEPENALPRGQFLTGDHNLVNVQAKLDYAADEDQL